MKTYSLLELAAEFEKNIVGTMAEAEKSLHLGASLILKRTTDRIGHYQDAVGPYASWAELAERTKEERVRAGYSEDDPLFRSGKLKASYRAEVALLDAIVGVPEGDMGEIAKAMELGNYAKNVPERPSLGPAAYESKDDLRKIMGACFVNGVIGREQIHPSLGYDFEVKSP